MKVGVPVRRFSEKKQRNSTGWLDAKLQRSSVLIYVIVMVRGFLCLTYG